METDRSVIAPIAAGPPPGPAARVRRARLLVLLLFLFLFLLVLLIKWLGCFRILAIQKENKMNQKKILDIQDDRGALLSRIIQGASGDVMGKFTELAKEHS